MCPSVRAQLLSHVNYCIAVRAIVRPPHVTPPTIPKNSTRSPKILICVRFAANLLDIRLQIEHIFQFILNLFAQAINPTKYF